MSPMTSILTQRNIWREITFRCLSLMLTLCRHFLDFVHQVLLQCGLRAVHQRFADADAFAFLNVDMDAVGVKTFDTFDEAIQLSSADC